MHPGEHVNLGLYLKARLYSDNNKDFLQNSLNCMKQYFHPKLLYHQSKTRNYTSQGRRVFLKRGTQACKTYLPDNHYIPHFNKTISLFRSLKALLVVNGPISTYFDLLPVIYDLWLKRTRRHFIWFTICILLTQKNTFLF